MHLELKAVRDINSSHIGKSTCLYTHLYTFIYVQLINSIESHCKDDISWDTSLKHKTWGSVKSPPLSRFFSFRFVVFQRILQVDALKMSVENLTQDVKELQEPPARGSCWREFGGWKMGGLPWGCIAYPPFPPPK